MLSIALLTFFAVPLVPQFHIASIDGKESTGPIKQIGPDWQVLLAESNLTVPGPKLATIRQVNQTLPPWPDNEGIILTSGDRIPGKVVGGDDRSIRFLPGGMTRDARAWSVPVPLIQIIWYTTNVQQSDRQPADYSWLEPERKTDFLRFRNGDSLSGSIEKFLENGAVQVRTADGTSKALESAALACIALNPRLAVNRKPRGTFARIVTRSGMRLTLVKLTADGQTLRGTTSFNAAIELPLDTLVEAFFVTSKMTELGELTPMASYESHLGLNWPWTRNVNVKHRPLTLIQGDGIDFHDFGIGTHSKTTLTYALQGRYRSFSSLVGLDAITGRRGEATVQIYVDDQLRDVAGLDKLTAEKSVAVQIDVNKAKVLKLVVDHGRGGDVQTDVNWIRARLTE